MANCVQTPTLTNTEFSTSESLFPTSSVLTSTGPSSVSTSLFETCTQTNSSIPCRPTLTSSLVTIPGNVTVETVPVTGTIDVTFTNFVTLFGSTCSTPSTPPPPPPTSPTTSPSSSTTPSSVSTPSFSISTPPPSLVTTSSVFTSDGSTFVDVFTSTSTSSPITIDTSSGTSLPNNGGGHTSDKKSSNAGPIAGGVVGGLAVLALLGLLTLKLIKKQSRFDDIFNPKAPGKPHYKKATQDAEPKPYNYGPVGQNTNTVGVTPPSSPPPVHSSLGNDVGSQGGASNNVGQPGGHTNASGYQGGNTNNVGYQPGNTNNVGYQGGNTNAAGYQGGHTNAAGYQGGNTTNAAGYQGGNTNPVGYQPGNEVGHAPTQSPLQHLRNPSLTPLLAGAGVAAAAATANAVNSSRPGSSRPSSSASSQPSGPLVTNAQQPQGYPPVPNSSYPPALQNWSSTQGYATGGSSNPATTNAQAYGSGSALAGHSTGLSQSGSLNSVGSDPSTYSTSSGGPSTSGGMGAVYNPVLPGIMPVMAAAGMRNNSQNAPRHSHQPTDPFDRSGSPVSIQEQRILQVTNGEPSSPNYRSSVYDPDAYYSGQAGPSSSSSATAGPSFGGSQAGSSSSGGIDGKGRPLNLQGEKAPIVHLDGGLYQESGAPVAPAPPAYQE